MPFPWENYVIEGLVPDYTSGTVTATNRTTGESQTTDIQADNSYNIDCANFMTNGWSDLDTISFSTQGRYEEVSINKTQHPGRRLFDILPPHYNHRRNKPQSKL